MTAATDLHARTPPRPASPTPAPSPAVAALVASVGAAAFAFVTVANPPRLAAGPPHAGPHRWLAWLVTTLPQQRPDTGVAIAAFLCLLPLAGLARDLLGRDRALARTGAAAMAAGALLLPAWLVWTGGLLRNATTPQARTRA
jgi:hypothetical protein